MVGVFALALLARVLFLLHLDSQDLGEGYDPATYYTAASALLHGRAPYHGDFTFLHPPLVILVGVPFALLGWLTTAHVGYLAAGLAGCLLGAFSAAGVTFLAREWGLSRLPAVTGGAFLALWTTSAGTQAVFRLEPIGDALFVGALIALGAGREIGTRRLVVAGVLLGLLVNVKAWWVVVVVVVLALTALRVRRWAAVAIPLAAAAVTAVIVDLPFLLVARGRMFHSIVTAQLDRTAAQGTPTGGRERFSTLSRLDQVTGVSGVANRFLGQVQGFDNSRVHLVTVVVCCAFLVLAGLALRTPLGRFAVPLCAVQLAAVLSTPLFFGFYGDFVAVSAALVVAAGAGSVPGAARWAVALPVVAGVSLVLVLTSSQLPLGFVPVPDRARIAAAVRDAPCVVSDSPRFLIAADAVDASLAPGCRNFVDIQGVGHGGGPDPDALIDGPSANRAWRRQVAAYLASAPVIILGDPNVRTFLGPRAVTRLTRDRPTVSSGGVTVYGPRRPVR